MTEASATAETSIFDLPAWTGQPSPTPEPSPERVLVGVRFQRAGKVYHYDATHIPDLKVGDWVIVESARGKQMAQVATLKPPNDPQASYRPVERRATGRDMAMRHYYQTKELEAMIACRAESAALKLPIKIVRAEYSFDGQTLTFLYSSDEEERVEVGALREAMSRLYRARIEMRQISPREVAKLLGGMGACGIEERCCSRFLTEFSPISIKHAKEQNLSLNPHDITGMCGRLRCCLIYEYEQYVEARRHLPKLKSIVGTPMGEGKVVEILHLRDSVRVKFGEGADAREVVFHREQLTPLEELKRLQEKAMSGTCDKHEGGECSCGRKDAVESTPAVESNAAPPSEQRDAPMQHVPISAVLGVASSGAKKKRKKKKPDAAASSAVQAASVTSRAEPASKPAEGEPAAARRRRRKKRASGKSDKPASA